ncbi:MAG: DUF5714 domain-containing protein [Thermodesulfobacteriota bacterium]
MQNPETSAFFKKINNYSRLEYKDTAIYAAADYPFWIAVNKAGDRLIQNLEDDAGTGKGNSLVQELKTAEFLKNFPDLSSDEYKGRSHYLDLSHIEECWIHITDSCNLKCTHCLFSCSPQTNKTLEFSDIKSIVDQSYNLGARVFYLTGGEPFVHKNIKEILSYILNDFEDTSVVVLTNGTLLDKYTGFINTLPLHRLYFQISADGTGSINDKTRGKGSYDKLLKNLEAIKDINVSKTLSMTVHLENLSELNKIVDLAAEYNFISVHFMWLILTGSAKPEIFADPDLIFEHLEKTFEYAEEKNIKIDNLKNFESLIFSAPGTKYDLGNSGWRSVAVGPDKNIYPTAAMIGRTELICGSFEEGLEKVWKESEVLNKIRNTTVKDSKTYNSPLKYITGGGDIDHSYFSKGEFEGFDPYLNLYENIILWLINSCAEDPYKSDYPEVTLKMGDKLLQCHSDGEGVSLTHSNCVLTFSGVKKTVADFYTNADQSGNQDIINPVCYPEEEISHIPSYARIKSYGCGSPVLDSEIKEGEVITDLGSGAGLECFIASAKTGKNGAVYGIDMLDHMLLKAKASALEVSENLGYSNIEFKKGYLEKIPLKDETSDLVISNCVINLSEDKKNTLQEIYRILKPGGRIVISDVVTDELSPASVQNDEQLQGECIAGAMVVSDLFRMLGSSGFSQISVVKRFFYRKVKGHDFYSLTYQAYKPSEVEYVQALYPGPYAAVVTDEGEVLFRGEKKYIKQPENTKNLSPDIIILDDQGNAVNIEAENTCSCFSAPEPVSVNSEKKREVFESGCMVCNSELNYLKNNELKTCFFCSREFSADAVCENGHYVCDKCHGSDAETFVKEVLIKTSQKDMITLLNIIRSHPGFNVHGPEHHFTLAGITAAVYRNNGGSLSDEDILTAVERGSSIPGGSCAFWGGCGAPLGIGAGLGVILESTPLKADQRYKVQNIVAEIMAETAKTKAARCCQRESYTALIKASQLAEKYLDTSLPAKGDTKCTQIHKNNECIKKECPFYGK